MLAPYFYNTVVSCDIETTGLDERRAELLSVAMIADYNTAYINSIHPINLPFLDVVIVKPKFDYFEPGAIKMNVDVIDAIAKANYKGTFLTVEKVKELIYPEEKLTYSYKEQLQILTGGKTVYATPEVAIFLMRTFCTYIKKEHVAEGYDMEIAGKNLGKFDIPVLRNFFERECGPGLFEEGVLKLFSYRYAEVGSMFRAHFGKQVSLSAINKLFGRNDVEHKAYADGLDTVRAIRLASLKSQHPETSLEDLAKEVG